MLSTKITELNLPRYLAEPEKQLIPWILNKKTRDEERCVSIETYTFTSQIWPKVSEAAGNEAQWQHTLVLYRPDVLNGTQSLLFVNGGTRNPQIKGENPKSQCLDFARLAALTKSLVIDLQDVPNQYLTLEDTIARKGDSLYAYSWHLFMTAFKNQAYWPLSLPMTKAIIKAMDTVQQIMFQEYFIRIEHFVVAGLSKRGLATWLAALHDERISAIIPVVIDTLNTRKIMQHIYTCFNNHWPPAFHDFIQEKIPDFLSSTEFEFLMKIEDPLAYLRTEASDLYKKRLSIPKYIVSASGDDFFVPDCLNLYLDQLPGETRVRLVPNQGHLIDLKVVEEALLAYYRIFLKRTPLPFIKWSVNHPGMLCHVIADKHPTQVKLWEAENPLGRDFRFTAGVRYVGKGLAGSFREGFYQYPVQVSAPAKGWKAHFVEMTFQERQGDPLILTTPAYIVGSA